MKACFVSLHTGRSPGLGTRAAPRSSATLCSIGQAVASSWGCLPPLLGYICRASLSSSLRGDSAASSSGLLLRLEIITVILTSPASVPLWTTLFEDGNRTLLTVPSLTPDLEPATR